MMKMSPLAPPRLVAMAERIILLESQRALLFKKWKKALETSSGNITQAAALFDPPINRNRGNKLTHRFGLVEYAAQLRKKATGRMRGRPWQNTKRFGDYALDNTNNKR